MVVVHRDNNDLVCMRVEAIILVHGLSVAGIFDDFGHKVAERPCEKGELLVRRT